MKKALFWGVIVLFLSACQPKMVTSTTMSSTETLLPVYTETATQTVTPTSLTTQSPATPTSTQKSFQVCSPLEDESFTSLLEIIANPLKIPTIGRDDGHHGVDFSYYRRGERETIQGVEIYAILSGKTVITLEDHNPYGYTILVETPLSNLPGNLQEILLEQYRSVPQDVNYQGECPSIDPPQVTGELSLYHLYAHFETKPGFQPGEPIACGQLLGTVGNSGRSSNPHLHLETRLGPSNAALGDMAFYETTYTQEQRANYCLWRMSGYFQLVDPFLVFDFGR